MRQVTLQRENRATDGGVGVDVQHDAGRIGELYPGLTAMNVDPGDVQPDLPPSRAHLLLVQSPKPVIDEGA